MTTTQLGTVAVNPKQNDKPRPRSQTGNGPPTGPDKVLDALLNNMGRGRADRLATEIGVSKQTVTNLRTGASKISVERAAEIARALDVDPTLFFGHHHDAIMWLITHGHPDFACKHPRAERSRDI
jgi:transcriptional regulator with XRE-family HTH domain